jgi:hypothetical protein
VGYLTTKFTTFTIFGVSIIVVAWPSLSCRHCRRGLFSSSSPSSGCCSHRQHRLSSCQCRESPVVIILLLSQPTPKRTISYVLTPTKNNPRPIRAGQSPPEPPTVRRAPMHRIALTFHSSRRTDLVPAEPILASLVLRSGCGKRGHRARATVY